MADHCLVAHCSLLYLIHYLFWVRYARPHLWSVCGLTGGSALISNQTATGKDALSTSHWFTPIQVGIFKAYDKGNSMVTEWCWDSDFSLLHLSQTKTNDCKVKQTIQLYAQWLLFTDVTKTHLLEEQCRFKSVVLFVSSFCYQTLYLHCSSSKCVFVTFSERGMSQRSARMPWARDARSRESELCSIAILRLEHYWRFMLKTS